jgi:UDP-N-acetylmuramyl pentapeptide synthase
LEYGIDRAGEMDFLLSIAVPDIAVLTQVEPNHIEQFGTEEAYRAEKLKILGATKNRIVHESLRKYISQSVTYYGLGARSDVDASHIEMTLS